MLPQAPEGRNLCRTGSEKIHELREERYLRWTVKHDLTNIHGASTPFRPGRRFGHRIKTTTQTRPPRWGSGVFWNWILQRCRAAGGRERRLKSLICTPARSLDRNLVIVLQQPYRQLYCVSPRVTRMKTSSRPTSSSQRPVRRTPPVTRVSARKEGSVSALARVTLT